MALINQTGDLTKDAPEAPKIEFPCENYLIKVVAMDADDTHELVCACVTQHAPEFDKTSLTLNRSSKGRFVSFSFRILAQSQDQLAQLHQGLMQISAVKMVI